MINSVECPYCEHENDMTDGTVDLPDDNTFDHECEGCEREFEVYVEFDPSYYANKIEYVDCEKCGRNTRDPAKKGSIFPWPETVKEKILCRSCFHKALYERYRSKAKEEQKDD